MKKLLTALVVLSLSSVACGPQESSDLHSTQKTEDELAISLERPTAGLDYPTDTPIFASLKGKSILVLGMKRIVVPGTAKIEAATAGLDYPTDTPIFASLKGVKILVLDATTRLPIRIQQPVAGIDFPTDAPIPSDLGLVWDMGQHQRVALKKIRTIEKAVAGVDFPTDGPGTLDRDFYVYTSYDESFFQHRDRILATASR